MEDFLNSVPDVAWGALITGVFLFAQQVFNGRREDRRRSEESDERDKDRTQQEAETAADRQHALDLAKAEREHARDLAEVERETRLDEIRLAQEHERLQFREAQVQTRADLWRDERRAAHVELLALFEDALKRVSDAWMQVRRAEGTEDDVVRMEDPLNPLPWEVKESLNKAVANVQIIGSEASRTAATECRARLSACDFAMFFATVAGPKKAGSYDRIKHRHEACAPALEAYVESVRLDLGTAD